MNAKLSDLTPDPRNANRGTDRGRALLKRSLQDLKAGRSILVDRNGTVIAGNKTREAALAIGMEGAIVVETDGSQLVVVKRTDLDLSTDAAAQTLALSDNRIAELSLDWDVEQLAELRDEGADLSGLWTEDELGDLGLEDELPPSEDEEESTSDLMEQADQGELESRVQPGEIWALGRHRICCGDSTDRAAVAALIGAAPVKLVWADPPYGINIVATNGFVGGGEAYDIPFGGVKAEKLPSRLQRGYVGDGSTHFDKHGTYPIQEAKSPKKTRLGSTNGAKPFGSSAAQKKVRGSDRAPNLIPTGKYFPVIGDDSIETAVKSAALALSLFPTARQVWWGGNYYAAALPNSSCWIVWDKQNTGDFADAELAWTNSPTAVRIFQHMWNGLMKASERGESRVHPTQKPIALAEWVFEKYGQEDDLIFDPFLGSAPSLIAAQKMTGTRTVYGFELSVEYCEVICRRWEALTGQNAQKFGSL